MLRMAVVVGTGCKFEKLGRERGGQMLVGLAGSVVVTGQVRKSWARAVAPGAAMGLARDDLITSFCPCLVDCVRKTAPSGLTRPSSGLPHGRSLMAR
jgi:hypothetical protein